MTVLPRSRSNAVIIGTLTGLQPVGLAKAPVNSNALDNLGRYEEAIDCYDKCLDLNCNDAHAWYNRPCSKVKKSDIENGLADLKKAIEIDKKYMELAREDEDFESIRNDERFKASVSL